MKKTYLVLTAVFAMLLFTACGTKSAQTENSVSTDAFDEIIEADDEDEADETVDEEETIFIVCDRMPMDNDDYRELMNEFQIEVNDVDPDASPCRAIVQLVVEKDAHVSHAEIARSSGNEKLDAYALKTVSKKLKKFDRPAMSNGKPVRYQLAVPVRFVN